MQIVMLCHNGFLVNASGINTFITQMEKMCNKLNIKYEIITEEFIQPIKHDNIYYVTAFNNCIDEIVEKYKEDYNIYICDSLFTLETLDKLSKKLKGKFIYYTHIGDLIHNDIKYYDFPVEYKLKTIEIINNNNNILIGTQSEQLQRKLYDTFSKEKVVWLPEPIYINKPEINLKIYDTISILSNSPRKQIPKVIDFCKENDLSLNFVTTGFQGGYELIPLINSYNKINVLTNIPNNNIIDCISLAKTMIHFSEIEVFPYSILESASIIPVIINSDTEWGQLFPDELVYKVNPNNKEECKELLSKTLIPKMNLNKYQQNCEQIWIQFLKEGE